MTIALYVTIAWCTLWWFYGLYDVLFAKYHDYIPKTLLNIRLSNSVRACIKVLCFPLYVLYHCLLILFKFIEYLCIDLFFELILMGLLRIIGLVLKGMFQLLVRIFD